MSPTSAHTDPRHVELVIIGGGFAGIGMAIRLRQQGINDFVILERASAPGGTWRDNSYPGCACDVHSVLYSLSFAPNADWSHSFSRQPEIEAYLLRCVSDFSLGSHFRYDTEVTGAVWQPDTQRWMITTATGDEWTTAMVVLAGGALSNAARPDIPGLESFAGHIFHSSQWDHAHDLRGTRVAVIGTGASAIQFVPRIQPVVAQLTVFQRTPPWILPRVDRVIPAWRKALYRRVPTVQWLERLTMYALRELLLLPFRHPRLAPIVERLARAHMHAQVRDPALRRALTPSYRVGCKRVLVSDDFYPAVTQPNVALVTERIAAIEATGVRTTDGVLHTADTLILGTGFRPNDPPLAPFIIGRDGHSLAAVWNGSPVVYMGTTVHGFPNLFLLMGPNTGVGHTSVLLLIEAQIAHVLALRGIMMRNRATTAEPSAEAQAGWASLMDARLAPTVWNSGGCQSWYLDRNGRNSTLWPDGIGRFRRLVSRVRSDDYLLVSANDASHHHSA